MGPKVSAVLIAKNEEAVMDRCLRSVQDLDERLVLDTGSSDGTMEAARRAGARVMGPEVFQPFHFADARNWAVAMASNDWILSIDADEVLRSGSMGKLRAALKEHPGADAFELGFVQRVRRGAPAVDDRKARLFNRRSFRWRYRVHEVLQPLKEKPLIVRLHGCVLEHFPEADKTARSGQNLDLLKMCVDETPDHTFAWRELGMEFFNRDRHRDAIPALERWIAGWDPYENPMLRSEDLIYLGRALASVGRLEEAVDRFEESSRLAPSRREPLYQAGHEILKAGMPWAAIQYLERAAAIPTELKPNFHLNDPQVWGTLCEESLAFCREQVERAERLHQEINARKP